ncbi:hypothetical protein LJC55_01525, partial [Eubacteriales bacterium OttesenSCG-928-N14]|nr:hypothetical protein [Eubacteriales bacterium OttesenSCG-928-N14]
MERLNDLSICDLSRSLTYLVFRSGVVEDIHSEGKLSQDDMKRLNKDVHNRIAGLLTAWNDGHQEQLAALIFFAAKMYGTDWDEC